MSFRGVILFDIDGTLISCGGAGKRAIIAAFADVTGHSAPDTFEFSFGGMTDLGILREATRRAGLDFHETLAEDVLNSYSTQLQVEVDLSSDFQVLDGALSLLESLHASGDHALGLGTGNIERGARIKLERARLNDYFGFGGFGCDAEERGVLIARGIERGRNAAGWNAPALVIGDTPRDVAAAHHAGACCLAVATGSWSIAELQQAGADAVVEDLRAAEVSALIEELIP